MHNRVMNAKELQAAVDLKVKARKKDEGIQRRKIAMEELIHFKVLNDAGTPFLEKSGSGAVDATSEFRISRRNLNRASIMDCLSRSPTPGIEINFFVDNAGNVSISLVETS